ncbi:MAG: efflux RND transporter periplasmic adaptor subunit, partial [Pseudomonadota bacterium]
MTFTIKGSHILALLITIGIGFWMYGGKVEIGGQNNTELQAVASDADGAKAPDAEPANKTELFRVNVVKLAIEQRRQTVNVRGRTKADATIPVRSETAG